MSSGWSPRCIRRPSCSQWLRPRRIGWAAPATLDREVAVDEGVGPLLATPIIRWLHDVEGPVDQFNQTVLVQAPAGVTEADVVVLLQALLDRQVTVMTSYTMSTVAQRECADFVVQRGLDVDRLFTHRWRLDQAEAAYRLFDTQSTGKGAFLF